ncbi:unnamed protein product [Arctia plantaginis]|uniref:Uncharacterized protein n=1 Tax=Arctia plantaginis TaxID=874455 RepID=A0A8S1ANY9_ARCPL|nr:unnamed protein product [Arctia plantaginis]CAB3247984.1 unnamed protein product [Arctia plantaginis]
MWGLAPSPPRRASPPALRPVVNTSMASRAPETSADEPSTKFLTPTLASITESLSLLGVSPESLAMSLGESLADRYLATLRPKPVDRSVIGGCGIPRRTPIAEPSLQLFSNDFIDYLNQIA